MSESTEETGTSEVAGNPVPAGYREVHLTSGWGWVRPEALSWFREALSESGSLYEAARIHLARSGREGSTLQGRAPVFVLPLDFATVAVRHYFRGGAVARFLGDRYLALGSPRPIEETRASERLRSMGIPTPRVMTAAVYPSGLFYRADLVTELIPGGVDLGGVLFGEGGDEKGEEFRIAALREVAALIHRLADVGVAHPDLNVKNFLIESGSSPPKVHLLDLDRCRFAGEGAGRLRAAMLRRFHSSLRKWEKATGKRLSPAEWRESGYIPMS